ncbi:hypothetical protein LCGC14_1921460, partial [marine sediment metagenome]
VDPLNVASDVSEDFGADTAEQLRVFKDLRDTYGTSFLVAHHTNKSGAELMVRGAAWGSVFIDAWLETGWQIRAMKDAPDKIFVMRHFKVSGVDDSFGLCFDIDTESEPMQYRVSSLVAEPSSAAGKAIKGRRDAIMSWLANRPGDHTTATIAKATNISVKSARSILKVMKLEGVVACDTRTHEHNKTAFWRLIEIQSDLPIKDESA